MLRGLIGLLGMLLLATGAALAAGERVALVVGVQSYEVSPTLRNPRNDAMAVADGLRRLGFDLGDGGAVINPDRDAMLEAIRRFGEMAAGAELAVLYYGGHAVAFDGQNYLIPSKDGRIRFREDLPDFAVPLSRILSRLAEVRPQRVLALFDACRDNPLKYRDGSRSVTRGLVRIDPPEVESLIVYATRSGDTAADGMGDHSPFATVLLEKLTEPDLEILPLMQTVRKGVAAETKGAQVPELILNMNDAGGWLKPPVTRPPAPAPRLVDDTWYDLEPGKRYRLPVLANDKAGAGGNLRITGIDGPSSGLGTVAADGQSVEVLVPQGSAGPLEFRYRVQESGGSSAEAHVYLALAAPPAITKPSGPPDPKPGSADDFVVHVGDRVFFTFGSGTGYYLTPEATATLDRQAAWLKQYSTVTVTVEGHSDSVGSREVSLKLGERRANSVKNYLVAMGVDPKRIKTISYGKERPQVVGDNEVARTQNRRAVTVIN